MSNEREVTLVVTTWRGSPVSRRRIKVQETAKRYAYKRTVGTEWYDKATGLPCKRPHPMSSYRYQIAVPTGSAEVGK